MIWFWSAVFLFLLWVWLGHRKKEKRHSDALFHHTNPQHRDPYAKYNYDHQSRFQRRLHE